MKNILIISHAGGSPYHGPNMRSYYLGKNLIRQGYKVSIISSGFFHKYYNLPNLKSKITPENIDGIHYIWIKTQKYKKRGFKQALNQFEFSIKLFFLYKKIITEKPDFIIASSPHPFISFAAKRFAKKYKAKFIFEIRDLWPQAIMELGNFCAYHPYIMMLKYAERFSVKKCDHIVSIIEELGGYIQGKFNRKESDFTYIPNGFDTEDVKKDKLPIEIASLFPKGKLIVGYVGGISAHYGLKAFLKAIKLVSEINDDIFFVITGDGSQKRELEDFSKRENMENVRFTGAVPKGMVLDVIERFDICFLGMSRIESHFYGISPNKLFEYLYCEKPVIASINVPEKINPIIQSGAGISVAAEDEEEIKDGIIKMCSFPKEQLHEMGRRGKNYLLENHSFDIITKKYCELFVRLDSDIL